MIEGAFDERFLVLTPTGRDGALTCDLLAKAGIAALACANIDEVCRRVNGEGAAGLLLAEEALQLEGLRCLVEVLTGQEPWSDLPILLFTGNAAASRPDPSTARLLARLGNVTLLDRPVRPITMLSAASAALRARRRQYAARAAIGEQQRAVKLRDQFLAMLGHELRNPLSAILMAIAVMKEGGGTDTSRHHAIIERQANHLTRLVDDLLDVARVTSGKIVLQRSRVDLVDLVGRAMASMDTKLSARRVEVHVGTPGSPVVVDGDADRLEQVLANVVGNAVKYTRPGGNLWIDVASDEGIAQITIRDDGVGIAPEMLSRIFGLFEQAESTLDRSQGGMGIGLTLVRSLVELHGGRIEVASGGVGRGSTFSVRLPLSAAIQSVVEAPPAAVDPAPARHVLLVEDNEDARDMMREILEHGGHRVDVAGDGWIGFETAMRVRPEVMLIDIGLPGMDGYELARRVREALGSWPLLVALTGYGQPEDTRRAMQAGFDVHLTKPVDLGALREVLSRAVRAGGEDALEPARQV